MGIQSFGIKKGVNLHYIHTKKFKTTTLGFYFHRPLSRQEATLNALLPNVLKRGCPAYPETIQLARRLDELYGARLDAGVRKKGDSQIIHINFEFVNEAYTLGKQSVFEDIMQLAQGIVTGQTGFSKEHVSREKENLRRAISALINDKRSYANTRCIEIMCEHEPYGIRELGFTEDIDAIDENGLFGHYKSTVLQSPADVFICGDADIDRAREHISRIFENCGGESSEYPESVLIKDVSGVKSITESENVAQGKLSLGFRTGINAAGEKFPALLVFNALFGGSPTSKLFNNVREKLSLAYYVSSKADMFKGIMTVNSGIEVSNFRKAYDEIMTQLDEINKNNITGQELSAAILATVNSVRSMSDSAAAMEDYWLGRLAIGSLLDLEELTRQLQGIGAREVVEVSQGTVLDTVYFLKGKES